MSSPRDYEQKFRSRYTVGLDRIWPPMLECRGGGNSLKLGCAWFYCIVSDICDQFPQFCALHRLPITYKVLQLSPVPHPACLTLCCELTQRYQVQRDADPQRLAVSRLWMFTELQRLGCWFNSVQSSLESRALLERIAPAPKQNQTTRASPRDAKSVAQDWKHLCQRERVAEGLGKELERELLLHEAAQGLRRKPACICM